MTTERILAFLTRRRKPAPVPTREEMALELMRYRIVQLGDRERELNRWRDGYRLRTGRAA